MGLKIKTTHTIFENPFLRFEKLELTKKNQQVTDHPYYRFLCPDWVNILPVTADKKAILITQTRVGSLKDVLETPGGAINKDEHTNPKQAALRELEEETGYTSPHLVDLGSYNPNPALQCNRIHYFLALDAKLNPNRQHFPDQEEDIAIHLYPITQLEKLILSGKIDHALSSLGILLALNHLSR